MIRDILVPIDFSDCSRSALADALKLAKELEANVHVLNCYHMPLAAAEIGAGMDPGLSKDYSLEAKENFENLKDQFTLLNELSVRFSVEIAFPSAGIIKAAEDADLVIMGTHGASGLREILMGSIASEVVTSTNKPVLVLPESQHTMALKKIALATDYHTLEGIKNLHVLKYLAEKFNSEVTIIHVHPQPSTLIDEEAEEALLLDKFFASVKHNFRFVMTSDVEQGLFAFVEEEDIDLLAVMPQKHNFLENLFRKSITKKLVRHGCTPLLSIP